MTRCWLSRAALICGYAISFLGIFYLNFSVFLVMRGTIGYLTGRINPYFWPTSPFWWGREYGLNLLIASGYFFIIAALIQKRLFSTRNVIWHLVFYILSLLPALLLWSAITCSALSDREAWRPNDVMMIYNAASVMVLLIISMLIINRKK